MKRHLLIALSLAAIISCKKEELTAPVTDGDAGSEYTIYAEDSASKTVIDASFNVAWTDNDNLAVYTWPSGQPLPETSVWRTGNPVNYVASSENASPRPFALSESDDEYSLAEMAYQGRLDAFKNRFNAYGALDWGVIYPGKMSNASRPGMGIVVFGDHIQVRSRQTGNDNMDHLAFQDVLWGKASGKSPVVQMKHLGTMMIYTVENATGTPFKVTSVKITVNGANIGGSFRVNVFDGTFDSCMTGLNECTLWVENGAYIPAGGSAKFYQVLAPFSLNAGNKISVTVETNRGTWTRTNTLSSSKLFESGRKNHVTLNVDELKSSLPDVPVVEVKNNTFYVNGKEFFVKGAAVNGDNRGADWKREFWREAKAAGANVVRMYGVSDGIRSTLDDIAREGMYVCFGLNIGRQCNGFDYNDQVARQAQIAAVKTTIDRIKDHPAILMWCIGNELEGEVNVVNKNVWDDVNEISRYIHQNDSRPTTIAICWPWGVLGDIKAQAPDLDFICINQYVPEIFDVHSAVRSSGYAKPYIISEFGPRGTWSAGVAKTEWGGLIEETGTQKAAEYKKIYNECVLAHKGEGCIGSYVFLWGYQSHGDVLTWYAMYDQFQKHSLPAVDVMSELWTGTAVSNHAPVIADSKSVKINGLTSDKNVRLGCGQSASASVVATDADGDQLTYEWVIIPDKRLDAGQVMQPIPNLIQGTSGAGADFTAPAAPGNYRLIVYARDAVHGKTDMASFPFCVAEMLYRHDTDEIWFSTDSNSGGYFNLENAVRFTYGQEFDSADMDVIVFRGSGQTALTLAAPTDVPMQTYIDNSVRDWVTKNNTKFKKVSIDFGATTTSAELEKAYAAAGGEDIRVVLGLYESAIARTADGHYALIKVSGGTRYGDVWGSYKLAFKTIR